MTQLNYSNNRKQSRIITTNICLHLSDYIWLIWGKNEGKKKIFLSDKWIDINFIVIFRNVNNLNINSEHNEDSNKNYSLIFMNY